MLSLVVMYVHVPGMLNRYPCSEWRCQSRHTHPPFVEWETVAQDAYHNSLPQVPQCAPVLSHPGHVLLKHQKI